MVNLDVGGCTKTINHRNIIRNMQKNNNLLKTKTILKPKYKLSGGSVFTFSLPRGGKFDPLPPCQSRHQLWYFVFIYNRINCTSKIRAGGVAQFMGGPARCLINLCFGWVNYRLERRECFNINRYITVVNLVSVSQWLWHQSADCWLHYTVLALLMNRNTVISVLYIV